MESFQSRILKNRYQLQRELVSGSLGNTYQGIDKGNLNREIIVRELVPPPDSPADASDELLGKYRRHLLELVCECKPRVIDAFSESGNCYFVSFSVKEVTLADRITSISPRLQVFDAVTLLRSLAESMVKLHSSFFPLIHGDISPENIFLTETGSPLLLNCENSHLYGGSIGFATNTHPGFRAPETFEGLFLPSSDVYSLCALGHYLLTGIHPVENPPFIFPEAELVKLEVSSEVSGIIHKGLQFIPGDRYKNMGQFMEKLDSSFYSFTRRSAFTRQFSCPSCSNTLDFETNLCPWCNLDIAIYEGPDRANLYFRMGLQQYELGNYEAADRYFHQARRSGLETPELFLYLVKCHSRTSSHGSPLRMLHNLARKFPGYFPYYPEMLDILEKEKRYDVMESLRKSMTLKFTRDESFAVYLGERHLAEGHLDEAGDLAEKLILSSSDPGIRASSVEVLVRVMIRQGNFEEVPEFILRISGRNMTPTLSYLLGLGYLRRGCYTEAKSAFLQALSGDRLNWRIHFLLGYLLMKSGDSLSSLQYLLTSAQLSPHPEELLFLLCTLLNQEGRLSPSVLIENHLRQRLGRNVPDGGTLAFESVLEAIYEELSCRTS